MQQSILILEKSEEPFDKQIDIACTILGIDLLSQWNDCMEDIDKGTEEHTGLHEVPPSDPRPAHALRWVLRKLQSTEESLYSPRANYRAWILLRVLIVRTPLAVTARLLKTCKFMESLGAALKLVSQCGHAKLKALVQDGKGRDWNSDSSFHTLESSSNESQPSRKRKRGSAAFGEDQFMSSSCESQRSNNVNRESTQVLLVAICSAVSQLEELSIDSDVVRGYASEHMKFAMRVPPEQAATMLEYTVNIVNHFMQKGHRKSSSELVFQIRQIDSAYGVCISSVGKLWLNRFQGRKKVSDEMSNVWSLHGKLKPS